MKDSVQIVSEDEAEIKTGRISVKSPIARGLIGKMEGDEVIISTPGGLFDKDFEIDKVEYLIEFTLVLISKRSLMRPFSFLTLH